MGKYNEFIWKYLQTMHDVSRGCGEMASKLMLKYWNGSHFLTNDQKQTRKHT